MLFKKFPERRFRHLLSAPFIYMMIFPSIVFDLFLEVYHHICFPLYGISTVTRKHYIRIDRQKLSKLKVMEKVNCMYCGYVNGLMAYGVKIAGETEKYWCGIKHKQGDGFIEPAHHKDFIPYEEME